MTHPTHRATGFTLIELLIVATVIAILAAIAIPSYMEHQAKARRSEAQAYMLELQTREENYRANNSAYVAHGSLPGGVTNTTYYTYTITASTNTYTITATAQGSQATADSDCVTMTLDQSSTKVSKNASNTVTTGCWKS